MAHNNSQKQKSNQINEKTEEDDDNMFIPEYIMDERSRKGKKQYQIKWVGYSEEENTWEPYEHIKHLPKLLRAWEKQKKNNDSTKIVDRSVSGHNNKVQETSNKIQKLVTKKAEQNNEEEQYDSSPEKQENQENDFQQKKQKKKKQYNQYNQQQELSPNLDNDSITTIIQARNIIGKDEKEVQVRWAKRVNGQFPQDTWLPYEQVKDLYPNLVVEYYEKATDCLNIFKPYLPKQ